MAGQSQGSSGGAPVAAVVFDLFNTLTAPVDDVIFITSLRDMAHAVEADPDAFTQGWFHEWRERFDGTYPTPQASVRAICEAIGSRVDEAALRRAIQIWAALSRQSLRPRPDAVATLTRLRALGLRTALISNCSPDVPDLWPTTPFAQAIDEPLFSCVERLVKPDPAIYLRACERLRVDPTYCMYVGDGAHGELTGAQRVGMRTILVTTPGRTAPESSEQDSWRGEAIDALSELPDLITGTAATD